VPLLTAGRVLESPATGQRFEIQGPLGSPGGFGEAYSAKVLRRRGVPETVCVKASLDQTTWHREAYFGELLRGQRRVIQIFDSFPVLATVQGRKTPLYLLVSELAEHGTVGSYLDELGRGLPPGRAKQEVIALVKVLVLLHGGSATHRDLTPSNVLVCTGGTLKLADFGIARHSLLNKKATVTAANWWFVPTPFAGQPTDDVYMMGQLLAMLLTGEAWRRFDADEIDDMPGDDALHAVICRAIGPPKARFSEAWEMLQALQGKTEAGNAGGVRTLRNKRVLFTGPLAIKRADAETLVLQAGGRVANKVTKSLDVIVVGGHSPLYQKGHKGTKLAEVDRLNRNGADIRKIGEAEFRRLAKIR
jgi:serine/threonine protein kinase